MQISKGLVRAGLGLGLFLTTALASAQASAQWTLDGANSQLSFVTVKAEHVAEVHSFTRLDGGIDAAGSAEISVDLTSVETGIAIRNERMQSLLFETGLYPRARVSADVDSAALASLGLGDTTSLELALSVSAHGAELELLVPVQVTRTVSGLAVASLAPVIVTAESLELAAGIERLREIAGLPSISRAVPVTFALQFVAQ